ncbi:hypothetical protein AaE_014893 [Aphanomyces astaci]|uniref:Uncharacterized protein n=1 Tax=Aphanomyces astaci TaxID=112090 RepID=A0A6A4YZJ9_APHAT|nr:hypothetical protein AaE_014893 [Aphanomyces astaci]
MINTTLPVLLQLRLSSPEVNYWLAAVLEEFTAFSSFVIHTQPTKVAFLNMLVKLLKVPDPANAFLDSKCTAANSVANLIQVSGEQAAHTIVVDSAGLVGHLCALLHVKRECAQHSSLRALWRLAYYSPTIRDEVSSHLASVCVITINKDIVQIVNNLQLILAPSQPLKV